MGGTFNEQCEMYIFQVVRGGRKKNICTNLVGLRPRKEYWSEIRALDGGKSGVPVRIWFETIEDGKYKHFTNQNDFWDG